MKKKQKMKKYSGIGTTFKINNSTASGPGIKVYGNNNDVSGPGVKVFGNDNNVSGQGIKVIGDNNTVKGVRAEARGKGNKVTGLLCKSFTSSGTLIEPEIKIDPNIKLSIELSEDKTTTIKSNKGTIIIEKDIEFEHLGEGLIKIGKIRIRANDGGQGFNMICGTMNCIVGSAYNSNNLTITTKNGITNVKKYDGSSSVSEIVTSSGKIIKNIMIE